MANSPNHTFSAEVLAGWERLYNLLGKGYAHIAQNSTVEAEILGLFRTVDAASIEGTQLGKEYRNFSTLFINFLAAYNHAYETVLVTAVVKTRYQNQHERLQTVTFVADNHKKTLKFANDQLSWLVRERGKLVDRLALVQTYAEQEPGNIVMRCKCGWLQERLDDITADIAFERAAIPDLEFAVEHYEASMAQAKEKYDRLFFRLAELNPESARCTQSINYLKSQLSSFVMVIRAQFGFTFPPQ
ncbi:ANK_REP_REGION domain-containing protein [Psidium guajava]|nr:ANK_REP_REGION domain-containing protein [Psidium guajava]